MGLPQIAASCGIKNSSAAIPMLCRIRTFSAVKMPISFSASDRNVSPISKIRHFKLKLLARLSAF